MRWLEVWFQSTRPIPMSPRIGLAARTTIVPESVWGTKPRSLADAGLMQPAAIWLPATQGEPVTGSVIGLLVIGLTGSFRVVLSAMKSPLRCAAVGTNDCTDCAC